MDRVKWNRLGWPFFLVLLSEICVFTTVTDRGFSQEALPKSALDCYGDQLPAQAVARLGTVRFRNITRGTFSPDGKAIIGTGSNYRIHRWDVASGIEMHGFPIKTSFVSHRLVTSPDGKLLACDEDGESTIRLLEWSSGRNLAEMNRRREGDCVSGSLAFSSDARLLFSCDLDTARTWNTATGAEVRKFVHDPSPTLKHRPSVLVFSQTDVFWQLGTTTILH